MKKNRIISICLILVMMMQLSGCSIVKKTANGAISKLSSLSKEYAMKGYKEAAERRLGDIALPDDIMIEEKDDFLPMISDGYQKMTITLPEGYELSSYMDEAWMPYPMSDTAKKIVDGYHEEDKEHGSWTDAYIPSDIENGYYRFITYENDIGWVPCTNDESIRETFLDGSPQEYAVAAYDDNEKKIYIYYLSW